MQSEFVEEVVTILQANRRSLHDMDKDQFLIHWASSCQEMQAILSEQDCLGLTDFLVLYGELVEEWLLEKIRLSADDVGFLDQAFGQLQVFLQTGQEAAMMQLLACLQNPVWLNPVTAEDVAFLHALLATDRLRFAEPVGDIEDDSLLAHVGGQNEDDETRFCPMNPALLANEAVVTVDAELTTMIGAQCTLLLQLWQAPVALASVPERLEQTLEALSPIAKASEAVQLWGGYLILSGLSKNLACYRTDQDLLSDDIPMLLEQSLATISHFFQDISSPSTHDALIALFANPEWPYCLDDEQSAYLQQLFTQATVAVAEPIVAETVTDQDIRLDIPEDVDGQLLEMVFTDLPSLTEEFGKVLHRFLKTQDQEALRTAQRVAHTVKGSANMLGVKGLANLTHRLEDILEFLYQRQQSPDSLLAEALVEATDCLEVMCEALLARQPAPAMALSVLQQLVDAHYHLKTGQYLSPPSAKTAGTVAEAAIVQANIDQADAVSYEETTIRVPKSLLDQLFRIAGEVKIHDAQIEEQLKQIKVLLKTGGERYRNLQRVLGDLEQMMSSSLINPELNMAKERGNSQFDHLEMNRFNEMHSSISRLYEAAADSREIESSVDTLTRQMQRTLKGLSHLHQENLESVLDTRLVSVQILSSRLQRTVRQASRMTGKKVDLTLIGEDTLIDSQILNQLADPLMHIIRNSVDHGLESNADRLQFAKPENGQITIRFTKETDRIVVSCSDDGQGIKRRAIQQIAITKGLILPNTELSDQDIDRLILIPGFSTSTAVSQLSGRGIGMDVVYQEIIRLKGKLEIHSTPGQGCTFILSIPSSSLLLKANLVDCADYHLSIIQYGIDQKIAAKDGRFERSGQDLWFNYADERYQAFSIESLIGLPSPNYMIKNEVQLLIVNLGQGEQVAVMVDNLQDSREFVFKDMGRFIPHNPAIPGVTILANGKISPVLDLPEALRHKSTYNQRVMEFVAQTIVKKSPKILVVDDSLSARKSLATLLKDSGYEVTTAIDGQDALKQIETSTPNLVITDMEMPRMNGVELTAIIKQQRRTAKIPVLMITSRSTDKHRKEAGIVGVNAYLTKPWSETELLQQVEALL